MDSGCGGGGRLVRLSHPGRRKDLQRCDPPVAALAALHRLSRRLDHSLSAHGRKRRQNLRIAGLAPARQGIADFATQLGFNFFWSIIFFNLQSFGFAFLWLLVLWGLILWMLLAFRKLDPVAGWLQLPYLLWVAFAGYLNFGVWLLNR